MRRSLGAAVSALGIAMAGGALAQPAVEIRNAVVRVVVVPEARADVKVEIIKAQRRLPLRVHSFAGRTYIEGDVGHRIRACHSMVGKPSVTVLGVGDVGYDAMPQVLIHTPLDARVFAGGAVFGSIDRSDSLEFSNAGCGDWMIGNVRGRLRIAQAGAGETRAGTADQADLRAAGSGDIVTGEIREGLTAISTGSGSIRAAAVQGPFVARVAGSGSIQAANGQVTDMQASIAGSGDIGLQGVAESLRASVIGSGDVRVARVTGPVNKQMIGSGGVVIGR